MKVTGQSVALTINAPDLFKCDAFRAWLTNNEPKFSWHQTGIPGEYADVIVLVDPCLSGEGTDDDMPGWEEVIETVRTTLNPTVGSDHIVVRLTNIQQ